MANNSKPGRRSFGLLERRECLKLTWRGRFLVALICVTLVVFLARGIHPFLAVNHPMQGGVLVVEGWISDAALEQAKEEFKRNRYDRIYVTGGPLEQGTYLSQSQNYAQLGASTLWKLGLSRESVEPVPAPLVRQDRTYTSAVALKQRLRERGITPKNLHVISVGPHARRSWLLFSKVFGDEVPVGITALDEQEYDPKHWWRTSAGVRAVIDEVVAYAYARLFFWPDRR
jgi:hypothetical protein